MSATQVDATRVEEFIEPSEETTLKVPAPQNTQSPYDDDVILPDELGKDGDLDHEEDQKALAPQIIEDEDDEYDDEKAQDEESASKSANRATDFLEEEGSDEEED